MQIIKARYPLLAHYQLVMLIVFLIGGIPTLELRAQALFIHYYAPASKEALILENDSIGRLQLQRYLNQSQLNGYFHAHIDLRETDSILYAQHILNQHYNTDSIYWTFQAPKEGAMLVPEWFKPDRLTNWSSLKQSLEVVLEQAENKGYPFALIQPQLEQTSSDSIISMELKLDPGPFIQYDSLFVVSTQAVPSKYIIRYLGIKKGDTYNESQLKELATRIEEIPFLQSTRPAEVRFWQQYADIKLYVKRRSANQFNAILGIRPDDRTGKVQLNGDVEVKLRNAFNRGEELELNWRKLQTQTQDLFLSTEIPYWFGTPVGTEAALKIYKRDSTFVDVKGRYGLLFQFERLNRLSIFIDRQKISNLQSGILSATAFSQSSMRSYGLKAKWSRLDYLYNPRTGYELEMEGSIGKRRLQFPQEGAAATEYNLFKHRWHMAAYIPIARKQCVRIGSLGQGIHSGSLASIELLRYGGLRTLRGVDEESINANFFSTLSIEYRWLFERNSALYAFADQGWYESRLGDIHTQDWPRSFGVGVNFQTKGGIFTFNYALGQQFGQEIQVRSAKISFGFRNVF